MADDTITITQAEIDAKIAEAVDAATKGLKDTNAALKDEKTKLKGEFDDIAQQIQSLGGLDILKELGDVDSVKKLAEMRKRFEQDEQGKLLADGKYDEWFDTRTEALRRDHANQMKQITEKFEAEQKARAEVEKTLQGTVLQHQITQACSEAGIEPGAIQDVQNRAERVFQYDKERAIPVLRDNDGGIVFGKDGKSPKTVSEWLEERKEDSRHWWPGSRGGGAQGSGGVTGSGADDLTKLSMREYASKRREQGFGTYEY